MTGSVKKGNRLEYQIVYDLQNSGLDPTARRTGIRGKRTLSPRISEPGDVITKLPFSIECKNLESLKGFYKLWEQAQRQNIPPKQPLLIIKSNLKPTLAVVNWEEFQYMLDRSLKSGYPN